MAGASSFPLRPSMRRAARMMMTMDFSDIGVTASASAAAPAAGPSKASSTIDALATDTANWARSGSKRCATRSTVNDEYMVILGQFHRRGDTIVASEHPSEPPGTHALPNSAGTGTGQYADILARRCRLESARRQQLA